MHLEAAQTGPQTSRSWSVNRILRGRGIKFFILLADLAGVALSLYLAYSIRMGAFPGSGINWYQSLSWIVPILLASLYIFDLYTLEKHVSGLRTPGRFLVATACAGLIIFSAGYLGFEKRSDVFGRGVVAGALVGFAVWGAVVRFCVARWVHVQSEKVRWLVICGSDLVPAFWADREKADSQGSYSFLIDRNLQNDSSKLNDSQGYSRVIGTWDDVEKWLTDYWTGLIIDSRSHLSASLEEKILSLRFRGVLVYELSDFYEEMWMKVPVFFIQNRWLILAGGFGIVHNLIGQRLKRLVDILLALIILPLGLPIFLLAAVAVKLESKGPIVYKQRRTGRFGQTFKIYKLRSMRVDAEAKGAVWASERDPRVTIVGSFIRKTRIDELPQVWNVLKGHMSFIGPRPERPEFNSSLEKQIPFYNLRHLVRPGISGWAQVMYPYGASVEDSREKLQYDLYYIKNYSLLMDIAIVLKTLRVVLFGKGR
jgi:exopolysaccharide biosynthesis polyprenyl glycosylphosphotransferase